jgi:hypothetical protein
MRISAVAAAFVAVLMVLLMGCATETSTAPTSKAGTGTAVLDVVYLDHPPVRAAITKVDEVVARYQNYVSVRKLNAETEEGRTLVERTRTTTDTDHLSILLLLNGRSEARVDGRTVRFEGFPEGTGPVRSVEGAWTLDQLDKALAALVAW